MTDIIIVHTYWTNVMVLMFCWRRKASDKNMLDLKRSSIWL